MSQPYYVVQTRMPGEKFKTVAMGKGRRAHYYGKYIECKRAGIHSRFIIISAYNDRRYAKRECGETEWNNHTQTQTK